MNTLRITLKNCYGIKSLQTDLNFAEKNVYAIYAPNGSMKSSFARTFKDIASGQPPKDLVFTTRTSTREVVDENGAELPPDSILVIAPYDEEYGQNHSEKTSTLLVNPTLRKEYEKLHEEINKSKEDLLKALKGQSGSKKNIEEEVSATFTSSTDEFLVALECVSKEVNAQKDAPFAEVPYDTVFSSQVQDALNTKDFKTAIQEYITKYSELLDQSTYFRRGVFEYYNAATIAKNLADNGFFEAKHTVSLNASSKLEISTQKELEDYISKEKEAIAKDKDLRKKFEDIEKVLNKNANVREFKAYILKNRDLLPSLANLDKFRENVWKSYLKSHFAQYSDLLKKIEAADARKVEIENKAAEERTQWEEVIAIFNERFFVPFKLSAKNRTEVILGAESVLSLAFEFEDAEDRVPLERKTLLQVLSQGEKKALYILHLIFEIEVRRKSKQETVFIVDDIADSFDYRNKYAIIQYLKDIAGEPNFRLIILTHNFDFFRIVSSRFVRYNRCLMARKTSDGVVLDQAAGIKNVFTKDWKPNFFTDSKKKIASIPFVRNLIEYTKSEDDPGFLKLTSLLHWKDETAQITEGDLDKIFCEIFGGDCPPYDDRLVIDLISAQGDDCLTAAAAANFEHKIVLSIYIRLTGEKFMVDKISDPAFVNAITSNQTQKLVKAYSNKYPTEVLNIRVLQKVALMTPENIHLNSFMYEPILDMSDDHLRKLCQEVKALA